MGVVLLKVISHLCCSSATNASSLWTRLDFVHVLSFLGVLCALSKSNTISSDHWHYEILYYTDHYMIMNTTMGKIVLWVCAVGFVWASGHGPEKPSMSKGSAVLQQAQRYGCNWQEQRAILPHWAKISHKMRVLDWKIISEGNIWLHTGRIFT